MKPEILRMENIRKTYRPDVLALDGAGFSLREGEIHALAGENGAGKTTLMKILTGIERPDEGQIFWRGEPVEIPNPNAADGLGIAMVHQHFMLVEDMTVAENIALGREPRKGLHFDRARAEASVLELAHRYDMPVHPETKIRDLSVGLKQKVEILKVLSRNARILLLDEPTAVLTPQETKELFRQLILLKEAGHTIVLITHKLKEIKEVCDRITVMKSGMTVGTFEVGEITEAEISRRMIGYDFVPVTGPGSGNPGMDLLHAEGLCHTDERGVRKLHDLSFSLREGEILGVVGIEGNGQEELVAVLSGQEPHYEGTVTLDGTDLKGLSVSAVRSRGLSYIPEDRMHQGVDATASVWENAAVHRIRRARPGFFLRRTELAQGARKLLSDFDVKCDSPREPIKALSGGNMQKIVSGREIEDCGRVLIADQPTRGIDVGSAVKIHERIVRLAREGKGILLVSSDLQEIHRLSGRILVLFGGEIVAEFDRPSEVTEEELGLCMLGLRRKRPGTETGDAA